MQALDFHSNESIVPHCYMMP